MSSHPVVRSLRSLWGEPGYTLVFVLTLGLGIGANTAIFSLVNGVLLRPLPYPEADRIVYLEQPATERGRDSISFSFTEIADLREQASSLEEVVEFGDWTFNVLGRGDPHRAVAGLVTANFFEVLGMRPQLGRLLQPSDRDRGAEPVVVLTHDYWTRVLGAAPDVIGQKLDLTAKVATIVGVLAPGAHYATQRGQDFYANYASNDHYVGASMQDERSHRMTDVFALVAPGKTAEDARLELNQIADRLHAEYPDDYPTGWGLEIAVTPWKEELVQRARPTLLILLATAGFVLLIACANVANLSLARLIRRQRELALRTALGAGRARLRGLLFGESLVLALLGAAVGVVIAAVLRDALVSYTSRFTTRTGEIGLDPWVLAFTVLVAVVVAVAFATLPGLMPESRLAEMLGAGGGHATAAARRRRLQRLLVVGQLAASFVLLIGAGLMLRTLVNLYSVDPGFELGTVLSLEAPKFGPSTPEAERGFAEGVRREVGGHPAVHGVAMAQRSPLGGSSSFPMNFRVDGAAADEEQVATPTVFESVSVGFFETLGVPMLHGRVFEERDDADAPPVAVINQAMAEHYFGERDPLGRSIAYSFGRSYSDDLTIVGVVANTRPTSLDERDVHAFYLAQAQSFSPSTVLVRTAGDPAPVTPHIVETLRRLDPERPLEHIRTLAEARNESIAPQRLNATLFGAFALLALIIAAVGVAAVLAFSVSARRRELGIRAALGAEPLKLHGLVLGEGLAMASAGLLLGALGAFALVRFLRGLLFEVQALDPATFLGVGGLLLVVAVASSWLPARRATATDPIEVLRSE